MAIVSITDFGAATGNTAAQNKIAIDAAFQTAGLVFIPIGTFKTDELDPPICAGIVGEGELVSILKIVSGNGLSLGGFCKAHRDYRLLGNDDAGAVGLHFGDASSGAYTVENVRVSDFNGAGAVGIRYGNCLKSVFINVTSEQNTLNELWQGSVSGFPTTLLHLGGVSNNSASEGGVIRTGCGIVMVNKDFESSGREGLLIQPDGDGLVEDIVLDTCWFEANWKGGAVYPGNTGSGYSVNDVLTVIGGTFSTPMTLVVTEIDGSGGILRANLVQPGLYSAFPTMPFATSGGGGTGASLIYGAHLRLDDRNGNGYDYDSKKTGYRVWPSIRDTRFTQGPDILGKYDPMAIFANGVGCNPIISAPRIEVVQFPSIVLQHEAQAEFPDASARYDYAGVVSAPDNCASFVFTGWRDYVPVFTAGGATPPVGPEASFSATPAIAHSRFRRQGKTFAVSMRFSATLQAITPTNINITLPANIVPAYSSGIAVNLLIGSTWQSGRLAWDPSSEKLYVQKADLSAWPSGSTFSIEFDAQFEIV